MKATTWYKGARRWTSKMSERTAGWGGLSSCAEHREELELQRGGGVSILGGAEELGGGGGCGPTNRTTQLLITHLTRNWQEMFTIWFSLTWPREVCICETYFEVQVVHVFVWGAVDGSFGGELQGVEEIVTLDTEGARQLK